MADTRWIENIKQIVLQSEEARGPCDVLTGIVESSSPLSVRIDQKLVLSGPQLLVAKRLTDYEVTMVLPEVGETAVPVKNGLKAGETVLLVQKRGGQEFAVIDRC